MKALSLPLTIVIIAVVLLVSALVVMTVFSGQMAQFIGVLNPWSQQRISESLCYDQCASWCRAHAGEAGLEWADVEVETQGGTSTCDGIMREVMGEQIGSCQCT
jgi:hypothetical protein